MDAFTSRRTVSTAAVNEITSPGRANDASSMNFSYSSAHNGSVEMDARAQVTNGALRDAGLAARLDHRSYKDQGIDREPQAVIPQAILYSERLSGRRSPAGDDIRARHRERVEARLKGAEELARVVQRQKAEGRQRALQWAERRKARKEIPQCALTREQLKQKQREYCKANAQEINRKEQESLRRWSTLRQQQQPEIKPTQELDPARQDTAALGQPRTSPSADEAVNNWLAYRESQRRAESSRDASPDGARDHPGGLDRRDAEEAGKDSDRRRNNDAAL